MDWLTAVVEVFKSAAWPVAVVVIAYWFKSDLRRLLIDLEEIDVMGIKGKKYSRKIAELATQTAQVELAPEPVLTLPLPTNVDRIPAAVTDPKPSPTAVTEPEPAMPADAPSPTPVHEPNVRGSSPDTESRENPFLKNSIRVTAPITLSERPSAAILTAWGKVASALNAVLKVDNEIFGGSEVIFAPADKFPLQVINHLYARSWFDDTLRDALLSLHELKETVAIRQGFEPTTRDALQYMLSSAKIVIALDKISGVSKPKAR